MDLAETIHESLKGNKHIVLLCDPQISRTFSYPLDGMRIVNFYIAPQPPNVLQHNDIESFIQKLKLPQPTAMSDFIPDFGYWDVAHIAYEEEYFETPSQSITMLPRVPVNFPLIHPSSFLLRVQVNMYPCEMMARDLMKNGVPSKDIPCDLMYKYVSQPSMLDRLLDGFGRLIFKR